MVFAGLVTGAAVRFVWLGVGLVALARLRRRSTIARLSDDVEVLRKGLAPATAIQWHHEIVQPVAFGWRRPIVLLPRRVVDLPPDAQRAVACHELLHVARRDWMWMLAEDGVRCVFWFHPAVWFALARLQLSREQLVDETVVQLTGIREAYARALALFAGEPTAFAPAMPFIICASEAALRVPAARMNPLRELYQHRVGLDELALAAVNRLHGCVS